MKNKISLLLLLIAIVPGFLYACAKTASVPRKHPMQVTGLPNCSECHTGTLAALNHQAPNWYRKHQLFAQQRQYVCAVCHEESFCTDCHAYKEEIKPSDKHADSPELMLPHRGDYLSRHRIDGRINPASCLKCHGRQNNEECKTCHR